MALSTADGVSLRDLICRVTTPSSIVTYSHAAIPLEYAKRWKRSSLPASAATGIVVCLLAVILGLMLGMFADRRRNALRQRGRSSAVIALPPPALTGGAVDGGDDVEVKNEEADSDDEDDIWNLFWMAK